MVTRSPCLESLTSTNLDRGVQFFFESFHERPEGDEFDFFIVPFGDGGLFFGLLSRAAASSSPCFLARASAARLPREGS